MFQVSPIFHRAISAIVIISFVSGCTPNVKEGAEPMTPSGQPLFVEVAYVNLIQELDPEGRGCESQPSCTLEEALKGFYMYEPPKPPENEQGEVEDDVLKVSNVAAIFAEKQARLLRQLVIEIQQLDPNFDYAFYFTEQRGAPSAPTGVLWLRELFEMRANDILDRVKTAQVLTPVLEFQRQRRNRVQARIVAASDAACDAYKRSLNSVFSKTNYRFGIAATMAGGLGAIFTGENTARAFAGTAGMISGARAEYNDAFFRNKVVEVLTQAMDLGRDRKLDEIQRKGSLLLIDYTIEEAIADALNYNASCTMIAGLQETQESLQTTSDPGLKWLANAFGGVASNEQATNELFKALGNAVGTIQKIERANEEKNTVVGPTESEDRGSALNGSAQPGESE